MPGHLNVALYNQVINNVQRTIYIGISGLAGNVHRAIVKGAEIDGALNVTPWLELGGSYSLTDAKFSDPFASVTGQTFFYGPYGDTPKHVGSAFFRAHQRLSGDIGELVLRGDVYAQTGWYYSNLDATQVPFTHLAGYAVANMKLEWNGILGSAFNAAGYVRNLGDRHYYVGGNPGGSVFGINSVLVGNPRTYGVEVGVKF